MLELNNIYNGDCLDLMKEIPDQLINTIIVDPPYSVSACVWDILIPFDKLWEQFNRIIKPNGAMVIFGQEPFSSALRMSNLKNWKYDYIWKKSKGCNFVHAKNMPIKFHEIISVFSNAKIGHLCQLNEKRMTYNPQDLIKVDKKWSRPQHYENGNKLSRESHKLERIIEFENYPRSILDFGNSDNNERGLHPTQKPIKLMEYLIKTFSNENDLILDNCAGSFSTIIAAINTKRNYIGIEKDLEYFNIGKERIEKHLQNQKIKDILE